MEFDDSYVVRIYRRGTPPRGAKKTESLNGVVETVGTGERAVFHDIGGLWDALRREPPKTNRRSRTK